MADGQLGELSTGIGLQARHAFDLGSYAGKISFFSLAIEWFELALDKFREEEGKEWSMGPDFQADIQKQLRETVENVGATPNKMAFVISIFVLSIFSTTPFVRNPTGRQGWSIVSPS